MKAALVIMAAGLGSRYGGSKQVDGIGPNGEILMEYSIYDALRAGFTKVVFIIKPDMEQLMRDLVGDRLERMKTADGSPVDVYKRQDPNDTDWSRHPERQGPLHTPSPVRRPPYTVQ